MMVLAAILIVIGSLLALAAAIGVVRFPDTLSRSHAMGVAATLGILVTMLGVVFGLSDLGAGGKATLTVLFVFLTSPVGSHMIGRATYLFGKRPAQLVRDDLRDHQDELEDHPSA
jgi:multicomponent Na+:H+ antiporter subunit G